MRKDIEGCPVYSWCKSIQRLRGGLDWGRGGGEVFIGIPEDWYDVPPPEVQRSDDEG